MILVILRMVDQMGAGAGVKQELNRVVIFLRFRRQESCELAHKPPHAGTGAGRQTALALGPGVQVSTGGWTGEFLVSHGD